MKKHYDFSIKTKPLPHQIEATNYIKQHSIVPLFDEQGLGKSKIVIDAMCYDIEHHIIDSVLVVCKKTLLNTWGKEIKKHTFLDYSVLDGSRRRRGRSFMNPTKFYLINYESLLEELDRIKLLLDLKRFTIVLDESQKIKNPFSKTTVAIFEIKDMAQKKIIITGSPLANRPEDLWSQFYFLDGGLTLGSNFNNFRRQFYVDLKNTEKLEKYNQSLLSLREKIGSISVRRTKEILELPEKIYQNIYVNLIGEQKNIYEKARNDLIIEIRNANGELIVKEIDNYLVKLLRLTQIASNPRLIDDNYNDCPIKFSKLDELVNDIVTRKEKVIIWSSFRENIRLLKNRYKSHGAVMLFGELTTDEKNSSVDKFQDSPECRVMVANPAVASVGLTLTAANNAIYLDRNFKMDDYIQSQDRIHRIGQERKCFLYKILAKDTIDEYTDEIIEKKYLIAQYCLGDRESLRGEYQFMTKEDILRILGRA